MEVGEARTFTVQPVNVRRFEDGIAVARQVAVADVVGEDEDDVGVWRSVKIHRREREHSDDDQEEEESVFEFHGARAGVISKRGRTRPTPAISWRVTEFPFYVRMEGMAALPRRVNDFNLTGQRCGVHLARVVDGAPTWSENPPSCKGRYKVDSE